MSAPLLFFFVLGDVLGSGIYALIGLVAGEVGGAIWSSFMVAIVFALLTGLSYAELVTKYPRASGAAYYVNKAFGSRLLTFLVTFCLVAAGVSAAAALGTAFGGSYFQALFRGVFSMPTVAVAAAFVLVLSLINFRGISESVRANLAMSLVELGGLVLLLLVGAAVLFGGEANLSRPFQFGAQVSPVLATLGGATLAFFAVIGFENAANVAEETRDPSRIYPRALLGAILTAGLLYMAVAFTASMVVPTEQLAGSADGALLEVVREGPLPISERVLAAIVLVAVTNTALVALIMSSRVLYGMAREGIVPRILARTHTSRRTPWVAIACVAAAALVLLFAVGTDDVGTFADATVVFILVIFILVNASVLVLRRDRVEHEHFRTPTALPVLGILACVVLLATLSRTNPQVYVPCALALAVGQATYLVNAALKDRLDRRVLERTPSGERR